MNDLQNRIFLNQLKGIGLPKPEAEFKFLDNRKFRFDFAYPAVKLAIEIEGGIFTKGRHTRGTGFLKDIEKYNLATFEGWYLLRIPAHEYQKMKYYKLIKAVYDKLNKEKSHE